MPEVKVKAKPDIRDEIMSYLKVIERNLAYLSKKSEINYHTLYSCLVQKRFPVSEINLKKINEALGTSF